MTGMANDWSSETPLAFYRFVYQEVEGIRVVRGSSTSV